MSHSLVCSCRHPESEHEAGGPCQGSDSYGLPCECPGMEVDRFWSGLSLDDEDE